MVDIARLQILGVADKGCRFPGVAVVFLCGGVNLHIRVLQQVNIVV